MSPASSQAYGKALLFGRSLSRSKLLGYLITKHLDYHARARRATGRVIDSHSFTQHTNLVESAFKRSCAARVMQPVGHAQPRTLICIETHRLSPVLRGPTRPVQSSASAAGCSCMTWSYSSRSTAVTPTRASPIPRARELQLDIHMFIGRNHMFNGPYSWNSCVHDTSTRSGLRYRRPPAN